MMPDTGNIYTEPMMADSTEAGIFLQKHERCCAACTAHLHNSIELIYVREGSYTVVVDGRECAVSEGDLVLFCANAIHYIFTGDNEKSSYYVIKAPLSLLLELAGAEYFMRFALSREGQRNVWRSDELAGSEILAALERLIDEHHGERYAREVAVRLRIVELLVAILRDGEYIDTSLNAQTAILICRTMLYVRNNFSEDIDERELARSVGMSYSFFVRSFKSVCGISFRRYLNIVRVRKAEQLLYTTEESITDIAAYCGYNSTSYFISVYSEINGTTPLKARKNARIMREGT